jgi:hypothetical protein
MLLFGPDYYPPNRWGNDEEVKEWRRLLRESMRDLNVLRTKHAGTVKSPRTKHMLEIRVVFEVFYPIWLGPHARKACLLPT